MISDVISDLADRAMKPADEAGTASKEIGKEVPSLLEVIAEAKDDREGRTPQ